MENFSGFKRVWVTFNLLPVRNQEGAGRWENVPGVKNDVDLHVHCCSLISRENGLVPPPPSGQDSGERTPESHFGV